jgi:protein disulfide-isomerase A1
MYKFYPKIYFTAFSNLTESIVTYYFFFIKSIMLVLLALLLAPLATLAEVQELTKANFMTTLALNPVTMVEYYAPWCGHCKKFASDYEDIAAVLSDAGVMVAKVDCVAETDLYWEAKIQSFPTIKMYVYSQIVDYNGPLELEKVVAFGRKFKGSSVFTLDEQKWYQYEENNLNEKSPILIMFTDEKQKTEFDLSCTIFDRVNCAISNSRELATYLDVPFPSYSMIRRFPGESPNVVSSIGVDELDVMEDLLTFFKKHAFPAVVEFDQENRDILFSTDRPGFHTHVIFPLDMSDADGVSLLEISRKLAPDYFGKCLFASIDLSTKSRYTTNLLLELEIDKLDPPLALMARSHEGAIRFFRLEYDYDELESGGYETLIQNWLGSIFSGEIRAGKVIAEQEDNIKPPAASGGEEEEEVKDKEL